MGAGEPGADASHREREWRKETEDATHTWVPGHVCPWDLCGRTTTCAAGPFEPLFQMIALAELEEAFVLQPSHDDARRDADLFCDPENCCLTHRRDLQQALERGWGNQEVRREHIRFCLQAVLSGVIINKDLALSMEKEMGSLMEEAEPEVIVGFVAQAELDEPLRG